MIIDNKKLTYQTESKAKKGPFYNIRILHIMIIMI